jgi:hypothetical protein
VRKLYKKLLKRKSPKQAPQSGGENVPRITADTVANHRDEVIGSARKYIYPLQHSKHRIVLISTGLFLLSLIIFFTYSVLSLYKFQNSSKFMYRVTQVIPFPIARTGSTLVAYENYLFELRRYKHYYVTQQKLDFNSASGQQQLADFKKRALDKVVNDTLIKQLAKEHSVSVSDQEIDAAISVLKTQNRLGSSDQVFEDVLKEFWDWSVNDFRRSLHQTILAQKVVSTLDTDTHTEAEAALARLKNGADFAKVAKEMSEDEATKANGGDFGFVIDRTNRDVPPETIEALFKLKAGEVSDIVNVGYGLEIINLNDLKDRQKVHLYLKA